MCCPRRRARSRLVQDDQNGPADVRQQPVERSLTLGLSELQHQRRGLEEACRYLAPGRLDADGDGDVRLAAALRAVEDKALSVPDEFKREHLRGPSPRGSARWTSRSPRQPWAQEASPGTAAGALGALAGLKLARERPRACGELARGSRHRGTTPPRPRYEQRPRARGELLGLGVRDPRHWLRPLQQLEGPVVPRESDHRAQEESLRPIPQA